MLHENPRYVDDLRFALDVMEEYSHLGLDSEQASKLRALILQQVGEAEDALAKKRRRSLVVGGGSEE